MGDYNYRGHRFRTQQTSQWHSVIWAPGSSLAKTEFPTATIDEGEAVCISRTKALIDKWEDEG